MCFASSIMSLVTCPARDVVEVLGLVPDLVRVPQESAHQPLAARLQGDDVRPAGEDSATFLVADDVPDPSERLDPDFPSGRCTRCRSPPWARTRRCRSCACAVPVQVAPCRPGPLGRYNE